MQTTSTLLMVRPYRFISNPQTQASNAFQNPDNFLTEDVSKESILEFDTMVTILRNHNIDVLVFQDPGDVPTPDSIFPNNWISFDESGLVVLYPMEAENRRWERRWDSIRTILEAEGYKFHALLDLSHYESQNKFLEGTGSMVLDRESKLAYACLSPRTSEEVLNDFCGLTGYSPILFHAFDKNQKPIYHTNVMMCVGAGFVLICLESISNPNEKNEVISKIIASGKSLIEISLKQMEHFAGNMLEIVSKLGEPIIVLSNQAFNSLDEIQLNELSHYGKLLPIPLNTIEKNGGGSARCMMAEIHLPK